MNPNYPVYVISKGRHDRCLTSKVLTQMGIAHSVVVEPTETELYVNEIGNQAHILELPFANLGQGSIPARNWVWGHAQNNGHPKHWILDDNIREFYRLNNNLKYRVLDGTIFAVAENFVDRYINIALAGFQYELLTPRKAKCPPLIFNTRIYSCILIDNGLPFRWRGKYNEDTDLSLRVLKSGLCTVLFNAFLANKTATMRMKGGNTDELYAGNGRLEMAKSLQMQHPDVTKITWKWGRWQHQVDYRPFKKNKLIFRDDYKPEKGVNNYGMKAVKV